MRKPKIGKRLNPNPSETIDESPKLGNQAKRTGPKRILPK